MACDACWAAAGDVQPGGGLDGDYSPGPVVADARLVEHAGPDDGGLVGLLMGYGVRWELLRRAAPAERVRLAQKVAARAAQTPADTRTCWEGSVVWLAEVWTLMVAQGWKQPRRLRNWYAVAEALAESCPVMDRPLTRATHPQVAAVAGVSTRTVSSVVAWLRAQGRLAELVPGERLAAMDHPDDETPAERAARREAAQRQAEVRRAWAEHARAEVAAIAAGQAPPDPPAAPRPPLRRSATVSAPPEGQRVADEQLVNVGSVYELRLPLSAAELADRAPRQLSPARAAEEAVSCTNDGHPRICDPRGVDQLSNTGSNRGRAVDGASRRLDGTQPATTRAESPVERRARPRPWDRRRSRPSRALGAAQRLLSGGVAARLTVGVSVRWLAAVIGPLVDRGWSDDDLRDCLATGNGVWRHLPRDIANPRGFIRATVARTDPGWPPSARRELAALDRVAAHERADARAAAARRERTQQAAVTRDAISTCPRCDELGWLETPAGLTRCHHRAGHPGG